MTGPVLYTGTHRPWWLWSGAVDFRLFVSHRTLGRYKTLPRARVPWALDSGGFSELSMYGGWRTTPAEYVAAVARYDTELGRLEWAAPQDWMCEDQILARTGLTIAEHQRRTVENFTFLTALWPEHSDEQCPFMPVLQGRPGDGGSYLECAALYETAGVNLFEQPVIGIGSVCRVQATSRVRDVARAVAGLGLGPDGAGAAYEPSPHWFGLKSAGIGHVWPHIGSCDSMAWSYAARCSPRLPGCTHRGNCANCPAAARAWRERVLSLAGRTERRGWQGELPEGEAA